MLFEQAASLVANRGYTKVRTFSGGIPAWGKAGFKMDTSAALPAASVKQIEIDEFRRLFSKVSVVDIRVPSLYKLGHFSKYMQTEFEQTTMEHRKKYHRKIPLAKLSKNYTKISKDRKIVVVDHNGKQAKLAGKFLLNNGFTDVVCIKNGLIALENK